jgi:ribosomal protein S18 acetylase RimI-like enzyme
MNTLLFTADGAWTISDLKPAGAPRAHAILRESAAWLKKRGMDQWQEFLEGGAEFVERRMREGVLYLVERGGEDAACVTLQMQDPFWDALGLDQQAAWVHSLAVRPKFTGRKLGKALLTFVESLAMARGRDLARLDVYDANARLKAYYAALGYRERDAKPFQGRAVRLMEKTLR